MNDVPPPPPTPPPGALPSVPSQLHAHASVTDGTLDVTWYQGPDGRRPRLVLKCADADLRSEASNLALEVLQINQSDVIFDANDVPDDDHIHLFLASCGWEHALVMRGMVTGGFFGGTVAYGIGGNIKIRSRVAKLAVTVAGLVEHPGPNVDRIVSQRPRLSELLSLAAQRKHTPLAPALQDLAPPAPAHRPPPPPVPDVSAARSTVNQSDASASWAPPPPAIPPSEAELTPLVAPLRHERPQPHNLVGIHPDVLSDPFMEWREWDDKTMWPYCSVCGAWSDGGHVASRKHVSRLGHHGYVRGGDGSWQRQQQVLPFLHTGGQPPQLQSSWSNWGATTESMTASAAPLSSPDSGQQTSLLAITDQQPTPPQQQQQQQKRVVIEPFRPTEDAPPPPDPMLIYKWHVQIADRTNMLIWRPEGYERLNGSDYDGEEVYC